MGLFSGFKSLAEKSRAAVIVQNLLERQHQAGMFDGDPARVANSLVGNVWDARPDVFNGKLVSPAERKKRLRAAFWWADAGNIKKARRPCPA